MNQRVSVLFVCMGNICRSPTAHAVFRKLVIDAGLNDVIHIDSAGTHAYHIGKAPDERSMATARERGIEMADLRARKVEFADLIEFDYVIPMDADNHAILNDMAPHDLKSKIQLFLEYAPQLNTAHVPDPYYGGAEGFDHVFDLVDAASRGLLEHIRKNHLQK